MAEPFQRRAASQGLFARLSGRVSKTGLVREIENLLARSARVGEVSAERIAELAAGHDVDLQRRFRTARLNLYRRFLEHCLNDQSVSAAESADLVHLRALLHLDEADVVRAHEEVVHAVYGNALDRVLEDQRLDPEEEKFLRRLGTELQISPEAAQRLYADAETRARRRFLDLSVVREDTFLVGRGLVLELSGVSPHGFEDAIRQALDEASRAYPGLARAEVTELAAELDAGQIARWRVKLKARRAPEA